MAAIDSSGAGLADGRYNTTFGAGELKARSAVPCQPSGSQPV
jgi:hypothetical protein